MCVTQQQLNPLIEQICTCTPGYGYDITLIRIYSIQQVKGKMTGDYPPLASRLVGLSTMRVKVKLEIGNCIYALQLESAAGRGASRSGLEITRRRPQLHQQFKFQQNLEMHRSVIDDSTLILGLFFWCKIYHNRILSEMGERITSNFARTWPRPVNVAQRLF